MRLDRAITLALVRPLRRVVSVFHRNGVTTADHAGTSQQPPAVLPILMYHSISEPTEAEVAPYYQVCTSRERFAEQMAWLQGDGWRGVTLSEGMRMLRTARALPFRPVAITFDDAYRDFVRAAFPVLQAHGFTATVYAPTDYIGDQPRLFKNRECLSWGEIMELHARGIEFGSHTASHPVLFRLPWPSIRYELLNSKLRLEEKLRAPVTSFAYPFAFPQTDREFTARFTEELEETGYDTAVTTIIGSARPDSAAMMLPRLPINESDDRSLLMAKVEGDYDWLRIPQLSLKWSRQKVQSHPETPTPPRIAGA